MRLARYGASIAGLVLEDLLKEHNIKPNKVGHLFESLHAGLNFLYSAPDNKVYQNLWDLWRLRFKERALALSLPPIVESHLLNTIAGICKQKHREYMLNRGGLGKRQRKEMMGAYTKYFNKFRKKTNE